MVSSGSAIVILRPLGPVFGSFSVTWLHLAQSFAVKRIATNLQGEDL
jgi:hypothetical protein